MKFAKEDQAYFEERKFYSEQSGPREIWSVIDQWPLYCGIANLARFIAISDLLRSTLTVPGHVAEFGSWKGANLVFLAKLLRIFDPMGSKMVHCFDTFEGLSEFAPQDGAAAENRGLYLGNLEELNRMLGLYRLEDEVAVHKGVIESILPTLLSADQSLSFSFVYCDTDLYESTKIILSSLHERLSVGGLFVLDQWNYTGYQGETIAVREFLAAHVGAYATEHVSHARQPSLVLRRLR